MLRTVTTVPATGAELSSCDELSIFLSAGCNLNCAYCHIKKEVSVGTKLSAEAIEKAIGLFLKAGSTTKKQICFTGGEPFLQGELLRSASSFARRMTPAHIQLSLNIVTNATLLQESDLSFLRGNNIDLKISLDGVKEEQDRSRPFLNSRRSSYNAVLKGIKLVKGARLGLKANLVFTPRSVNCLSANIKHLYGLGFRQIDFYPSVFAQWSSKDFVRLDREFSRIMAYCKYTHTRERDAFYSAQLTNLIHGMKSRHLSCTKTILGWDGNYYCCDKVFSLPPSLRSRFAAGDVHNGPDERLRSGLLDNMRHRIADLTGNVCNDCCYQPYCFCPIGHYVFFSSMGMSFKRYFPQFCRIAKTYIKNMLAIKRELGFSLI